MHDRHPLITKCFDTQHGLITRRQFLDTGLTPEHLNGLLHRGVWVVVRRGVYAREAWWSSLDRYVDRPRLVARAAHLVMVADHVLSHESAARELGMSILEPEVDLVHVTRRGVRGSRTKAGVKHHLAPYQHDQVVRVDGLAVLDRPRTALDLAREHGFVPGVVACDSARQAGVGLAELWGACAPMHHWPEVTVVRAAIQASDPGAESVGETLLRLMLMEIGLAGIQSQFEIRDATGWARCDLRVGRHLFEFDGRLKYRRRDRGGLAAVDPEQVVWEEKKRQDWACGFRLGMSRVTWAQLFEPLRTQTKQRLLREYLATEALFGSDISNLARIIVRRRV